MRMRDLLNREREVGDACEIHLLVVESNGIRLHCVLRLFESSKCQFGEVENVRKAETHIDELCPRLQT